MGSTGAVEAVPLSDDARGVLPRFEAMTVYALLLQGPDDALDHAVLLRTVRHDELLPEAITGHEARIGPRGEHQPVVGPQQERRGDASERPEPRDQRLLERRHRRRRPAASRELRAEQFARVTVDDHRHGLPAITALPDAAEARRPPFVGCPRHRGPRLDPRSMTDGPLADLPSLDLEDPLHRVLVKLQQARYGPVAERGIRLDQLLDRSGEAHLDLRCRLDRSVVHSATRTSNQRQSLVIGTSNPSSFMPCWRRRIMPRPSSPARLPVYSRA